MRKLYWSVLPGKFLNSETGDCVGEIDFPGTVQEWYEMLNVVMYIVARFELSLADHILISPDVGTIIYHMVSFRPSFTSDSKVGNIGKLRGVDVVVDPFQFRNIVSMFDKDKNEIARVIIKDLP